jgi:hypothetical protein
LKKKVDDKKVISEHDFVDDFEETKHTETSEQVQYSIM